MPKTGNKSKIATCVGHGCASNLIHTYGNDIELRRNSINLKKANDNKRTWQSARIQNLNSALDLYDVMLTFEPSSGSFPEALRRKDIEIVNRGIVFAEFYKDKIRRIVMECFGDISYIDKFGKRYAFCGPSISYTSIRPDTSIRHHKPDKGPNYNFPEVLAISQIFPNSNLGITRVCNPTKEGKIGVYVIDKDVILDYESI